MAPSFGAYAWRIAFFCILSVQSARSFLQMSTAPHKQLGRRAVLGGAVAAVAASVCGARAVLAEDVSAAPLSAAAVSETISYLEFNKLLLGKQVKSAKFYGHDLNTCVIVRADDVLARIGEGYPKESPSTDESPLKVVGQLRNAGVPYTVAAFDLSKYSKNKAYKSKDTIAAEDRQNFEDREVERLMR